MADTIAKRDERIAEFKAMGFKSAEAAHASGIQFIATDLAEILRRLKRLDKLER